MLPYQQEASRKIFAEKLEPHEINKLVGGSEMSTVVAQPSVGADVPKISLDFCDKFHDNSEV